MKTEEGKPHKTRKGLDMKTCYKCERCGKVFDNYESASEHENSHFTPKTWLLECDMKVVNDNTEWSNELYAPSAVVVPMERTVFEDGEWKTETAYVKYYYSAKQCAEQVFPKKDIDE